MGQQLSRIEIDKALKKIRNRYTQLFRYFKKSNTLLENFEQRYVKALKSKMDLSIFLMAEIDAVEELYIKEEQKKAKEDVSKTKKDPVQLSFADKVFEENRRRIAKYPSIAICHDADEEVEKLLGAVRNFLNNYWPAVMIIFKEKKMTHVGDRINDIYNKLLAHYDYTGTVPIARHYIDVLQQKYGNNKKADFEHRYIMQESAFLLNDILILFQYIVKEGEITNPERIIHAENHSLTKNNKQFQEIFKNKTCLEGFETVFQYLQGMIKDFRFTGIKKSL